MVRTSRVSRAPTEPLDPAEDRTADAATWAALLRKIVRRLEFGQTR